MSPQPETESRQEKVFQGAAAPGEPSAELKTLFERKQDHQFLAELDKLPEGAKVKMCIQCGTCGGMCPVTPLLDHSPRRLFAMLRAGMTDEVLDAATPWVCSSCYRCTVNCPAGIKITEVMYALKRRAIQAGRKARSSDYQRFASIFTRIVSRHGRSHEMGLLSRYMMFHHPVAMAKQSGLGMRLMLKGRMPLTQEKIKDREGLRRMAAKALELGEGV
ncbi:MAG TPA: 4Fe-4S dicluster domain-containing protein [Myxococcota bacterium]|nr:4Fe-4S dicluster domain-containing protein [Myxococcota bacterium]HRY95869.1 4Fe-4S dicluster domain-containing protein [Myxococcota bacterium]HSA22380.1 4Fe-4S dicluster domain-containing protein [Myxococcota bacterium]